MALGIPDELLVLGVVVFLLSAVLRWSFGGREARAERRLSRARDFGLLREVATASSEKAATFARDLLRRNGIRATTAPGESGGSQRVLVFPADAHAAADLLLRQDDDG